MNSDATCDIEIPSVTMEYWLRLNIGHSDILVRQNSCIDDEDKL